jgi:hypothetical protein
MEEIVSDEKEEINMDIPVFARSFELLSEKDKKEILNLIRFKNNYKE